MFRLRADDVTATLTMLRWPPLFRLLYRTPVLPYLRRRSVRRWQAAGRPLPPPGAFKQQLISEYARRFGLDVLVESGTFVGLTVAASLRSFARIYSIELDRDLSERAARQFAAFPHVTILGGDSGALLPGLLSTLDRPALFWLDAHYSGGITARGDVDTPIAAELDAVARHEVAGHVVLIDDAREFGRRPGYPSIEELRALLSRRRPEWRLSVEDDVIRVHH